MISMNIINFYQSQVNYSESTASIIDSEIKKIIDECYSKAKKLLIENRDILENMAHLLLEKETIYTEEEGFNFCYRTLKEL